MSSPLTHASFLPVLLLIGATFALTSPMAAQTGDSDSVPAQTSSNAPGREPRHHEAGSNESSASLMRDKIFLRDAAANSTEERMLSELATGKGSSEDVRQLAQTIVTAHAALDERLHILAESQGVKLPGKLSPVSQTAFDRVKSLSGEDFDREYLRLMMEEHHRDLRQYRSEAANTSDEDVRTFTQGATRTIHDHMVAVDQLARARGVQGNRPRAQAATEQPQ